MGLNYAAGCVNFRDAFACVNLFADALVLPEGVLFRGGKLDAVTAPEQVGSPGTVFNLRKGPDHAENLFGADYFHFPISNDHEKYETTDPVVRRWLGDVLARLADSVERFPVLLHYTSGKDRTGVAVAVVLSALGVERELIVQEYLFSEGEVRREWIETSLAGIGDPAVYFRRADLGALRAKLLRR